MDKHVVKNPQHTNSYYMVMYAHVRSDMIDHMPEHGESFMAKSVVLLDGTKPEAGELVICSSCKRYMSRSDLDVRMIKLVQQELR